MLKRTSREKLAALILVASVAEKCQYLILPRRRNNLLCIALPSPRAAVRHPVPHTSPLYFNFYTPFTSGRATNGVKFCGSRLGNDRSRADRQFQGSPQIPGEL